MRATKTAGWALVASLTASAVPAAGSTTDFAAAHHCHVLERLTRIHKRGPIETSRDRFLVLALARSPQSYVQCIFIERDTAMLCEASSGAYGRAGSDGPAFAPSAESVAVLTRLGFNRPSLDRNFETIVQLGSPPHLAPVATLMLTALRDAYGAEGADALEINAPKAKGSEERDPTCSAGEASRHWSREAAALTTRRGASAAPRPTPGRRAYSAAST